MPDVSGENADRSERRGATVPPGSRNRYASAPLAARVFHVSATPVMINQVRARAPHGGGADRCAINGGVLILVLRKCRSTPDRNPSEAPKERTLTRFGPRFGAVELEELVFSYSPRFRAAEIVQRDSPSTARAVTVARAVRHRPLTPSGGRSARSWTEHVRHPAARSAAIASSSGNARGPVPCDVAVGHQPAVAVDHRPPVKSRIKHVGSVEGHTVGRKERNSATHGVECVEGGRGAATRGRRRRAGWRRNASRWRR